MVDQSQHITQISKSKSTQMMKFGLLIEYKMRSIFLEKPYAKCGGEITLGSFFKKIKIEQNFSESIV